MYWWGSLAFLSGRHKHSVTRPSWYKYFISMTMVPHPNYRSTGCNNIKPGSQLQIPIHIYVPTGRPATALLTSVFLSQSFGVGRVGVSLVSGPAELASILLLKQEFSPRA